MRKQMIAIVLLSALVALTGCATNKEVATQAPATIEQGQTAQPAPAPTETTTPIAPAAPVVVNPLTDPNSPLSQRSIYFDFDNDTVKDEYRNIITAHAHYLVANRSAKITIQGNTDERGSREYNLALGQRRASAVKKMLTLLGVNPSQVDVTSFGEEKPRATAHDEAAWAQNRRADIVYQGE